MQVKHFLGIKVVLLYNEGSMLNINHTTPYANLADHCFYDHVMQCTRCELHQARHQVVFGSGPMPSKIMIIGEAPGEQEDKQGLPFVGRSGKLLTQLLEETGIKREKDVFIANIVKCRPPNNRNPKTIEVQACQEFLIRQIQLVQPKVVAVLGAPALRAVLGERLAISKVRGTWYEQSVSYMKRPLKIMPLFHPAYLLRYGSESAGSPRA